MLGPARIVRFDCLPPNVRKHLNEEYVGRASTQLALSPDAAMQYFSSKPRNLYPVLRDSPLPGGRDNHYVDPVVSRHFLVVNEIKGPQDMVSERLTRLWRRMSDALAAIRMVLQSNVSLVAPSEIYHEFGGRGWAPRPELECSFAYPLNIASRKDVRHIRRLVKAIEKNNPHIGVVIRRYNLSVGRSTPEDALINLAIAFEALYLPDGDAELKYRLQVRCACHLGNSSAERLTIFEQVGDLYKMRSRIVHGSSATLERAAKNTVFASSPHDALARGESLLSSGLCRVLVELPNASSEARATYFNECVLSKRRSL